MPVSCKCDKEILRVIMQLNKLHAMMKISLLLFLGFIATMVDARLDPSPTTLNGVDFKLLNEVCCDDCSCSSSTFPPCTCNDSKRECNPGCDNCACETGPTCHCNDYFFSCNKCTNSKDGAN